MPAGVSTQARKSVPLGTDRPVELDTRPSDAQRGRRRLLFRLAIGLNEARRPVKLSELPRHAWQAVLAAEDAGFYRHSGVEPEALARALYKRLVHGSAQGGSTSLSS